MCNTDEDKDSVVPAADGTEETPVEGAETPTDGTKEAPAEETDTEKPAEE